MYERATLWEGTGSVAYIQHLMLWSRHVRLPDCRHPHASTRSTMMLARLSWPPRPWPADSRLSWPPRPWPADSRLGGSPGRYTLVSHG